MAALAAHLEVAVHAAVEARNKRWKATMWSDFLKHAVAFLLAKGRDQDDVVAAAVGLIVYGVTTEEDLQGVAGQPPDDEKFKRQLAREEGVPKAICDLLFAQYVAPAQALHTGARKRSLEEAAATYDDCVRGAVWTTTGHLPPGLPAFGALFNVTLMGEAGLGESAVEMHYCRKETVALWKFMDNVRNSRAHYGYLQGLPGTGKSTGVWHWLISTAVRQHEPIVWMHFDEDQFQVVLARGGALARSGELTAFKGPRGARLTVCNEPACLLSRRRRARDDTARGSPCSRHCGGMGRWL
jgi:hypothetical protein